MEEANIEYLHTMSSQISLICIFFAGFSAAILASFVTQKEKGRLTKGITLLLLLATCTMLIALFCLTNIFIHTSEGYPSRMNNQELLDQFNQSMMFFMLGLTTFLGFISLTGWLYSRRMGIVTSILAIVTFVLILQAMN